MTKLVENNQAKINIELNEAELRSLLEGINRCTVRLESLIKLHAPMLIVKREIEMIQYRALGVLGMYECLALMDFACGKKKKNHNSRKTK